MKYYTLRVILFLLLFFSVERFCHRKTHGFRITKIQSDLPYLSQFQSEMPQDLSPKKVEEIFSMPFRFLNSGGECYVFVSDDGQYVLKFFKHHHMRLTKIEDYLLPKRFRRKVRRKRLEKLDTLFTSCKLAYDRFRSGTGLVYVHLNQTRHLKQRVKIYDAIGCVHSINLDTHTFALQKRAQMAYPSLQSLIEMNEEEAAKQRIASYIDLIVNRCNAGLADHDARMRNFGFIGGDAIELDLGSFTINEALKKPANQDRILLYETLKLKRWLAKRYPELSPYFEETLMNRLSENK